MNDKQKMFHDFFMSMVQEVKQEEAEELLEICFQKQDQGTFDAAYLQTVMPEYFALTKPEYIDKLKAAMAHFASNL